MSSTSQADAATPVTGAVFKVSDMTCAHCVGVIHTALQDGMPGTPFNIDMAQQQVTVSGDAEQAAALMREAGYEPRLLTA